MYLYVLFILVGFGHSEKSVLIIGGDYTTQTTVEQFFPSNMSTRIITTIKYNSSGSNYVQTTPINTTHAFVLPQHSAKSYYIDKTGVLTAGPTVDPRYGPALTGIQGENGQMVPIYCGGRRVNKVYLSDCQVMSADGKSFEPHSKMLEKYMWASLTRFGDMLIVIGDKGYGKTTVERYDDNDGQWRHVQAPPIDRYDSAWVKLNETSLLSCGDHDRANRKKCLVYHVDKDNWVQTQDMKASGYESEMVLIGQTVYAFEESRSVANIQTLDISAGVESAEWKIACVTLKKERCVFGVWVIDSSNQLETSTVSVILLIVLFSIFMIVLFYFIIGVLYRRFVVGARGIEQLPNHSFWLMIYRSAENAKLSRPERKALSRFRMSCHFLPVERQRFNNTVYNDRTCQHCTAGEVGTELHFLRRCSYFEAERIRFEEQFDGLSMKLDEEYVCEIMEDETKLKAFCNFILVTTRPQYMETVVVGD